ncbi:Trp biosynthesis-associated membrane protein [Leucobacter viscericola]|uniref:Trp biosynthesis-associated membrane protein n=1 Tax=Leucobacter viscericola TaxID=2714935 RepID=A0A6G7XJ80_9MICO|nr:Trp biosynthesis-associated membrane protein [Leucobacter viscericola]QIK64489.1 Trp biosynthesis-associated membrane protein [Leucobacter viscericola]
MRAKPLILLGIAATGAASLLAGSQTWVSFMLEGVHKVETVPGQDINPALTPLALALVAAALALTIAGTVFRRVLGVLVALLGAGSAALTWSALASPLSAISGKVTELTGITGSASASAIVWSEVSPWGYVTLVLGIVAALLGIAVVVWGGRWGTAGRKYDAERKRQDPKSEGPDRISDWDSLSEGDDPTQPQ